MRRMHLRFGPFVFDSALRELTREGERIPMTPKAFALLEALAEASPQPVSREALAERLWPKTFVEPGNLHNLVLELRSALGDDDHRIIRTVHRFGYALEAAGKAEEGTRFLVAIGDDVIPLRRGLNTIGRDPADTIAIDAPEVSRHHARIVVQGDHVMLEDLGSKNGTFLRGERISTAVAVYDGDVIVIGKTRLQLRVVRPVASTVTAE